MPDGRKRSGALLCLWLWIHVYIKKVTVKMFSVYTIVPLAKKKRELLEVRFLFGIYLNLVFLLKRSTSPSKSASEICTILKRECLKVGQEACVCPIDAVQHGVKKAKSMAEN